jgi:hypothetical protein
LFLSRLRRKLKQHNKLNVSPRRGVDTISPVNRPLLPIEELRKELADLEAGFTRMSDEELDQKIRILHTGFRNNVSLFHPGMTILGAVQVSPKPFYKSRLSYPPLDRIRVNGRVNRAGEAMFYGALGESAILSCLRECDCAEGEDFAISVRKTTKPIVVMHFGYSLKMIEEAKARRDLPEWAEIEYEDERSALIREWQSRVFTRVVPDGEEHLYRLGIALRNFALSPLAGPRPNIPEFIAGITYPAVSMWLLGDNIALLPAVADNNLSLQRVIYLKVASLIESGREDGGKEWSYGINENDFAMNIHYDDRLVWNGESTALSVSPWRITNATFNSRSRVIAASV